MTPTKLSAREIVERGEAIYRDTLRDQLEPGNIGKHIAIALESGDYEIDDDGDDACLRLWARRPGQVQAGLRIGYDVAGSIGAGSRELPNR
ncbi:MAG: hypothetical protein H7Y38_13545 [Armatimonadetes bacterium]|nr:hypothetical protein [Armatimonadota bacterium]